MVHTHPQWVKTRELIDQGEIGELRAIQGFFSYNNVDPQNIRNIADYGGGGMWDIGCYPVHTSRFVVGEEPVRVVSMMNRDPKTKIDRLASVILDYPSCQCTFMVSTQLVPYQRMIFFGSAEVYGDYDSTMTAMVPNTKPFRVIKRKRENLDDVIYYEGVAQTNDQKCRIFLDDGDLFQRSRKEIWFDICDQYTVQGEVFSEAILDDREVPVSLEDAYKNTKVLEAIFQSERKNGWVMVH